MIDFNEQIAQAETLEEAKQIYRSSQALQIDMQEGGSQTSHVNFATPQSMLDWAIDNEIDLIEHVNGDRYRITDLGIGINDAYIDHLTSEGLLPEVDDRGWETHRIVDGQIAISYNQEDASFADYIKAVAPALVLGVATAGLAAPLASTLGVSQATAAGILQAGSAAIQGGDLEDIALAGLMTYGVTSGIAQDLAYQALQAVPDPVINGIADLTGDVSEMTFNGLNEILGTAADAFGIEGGAGEMLQLAGQAGSNAMEFQNNTNLTGPQILALMSQVDEEFDGMHNNPDDIATEDELLDMMDEEFNDSIADFDSWLQTITTDFPEWDWNPPLPPEMTEGENETTGGGGGGGSDSQTADNGFILSGNGPVNHLPTPELPPEIQEDMKTDLPPIQGGLEGEYDESVQQEEDGEPGLILGPGAANQNGFGWVLDAAGNWVLANGAPGSNMPGTGNSDNSSGGTGGGSSTGEGTGDGSGTGSGTGSGDGSGDGSGSGDGQGSGEGDSGEPTQGFQPFRGIGGGTSDKDGLFGYRTITPATPANLNLMDYVQSLMARRRNL